MSNAWCWTREIMELGGKVSEDSAGCLLRPEGKSPLGGLPLTIEGFLEDSLGRQQLLISRHLITHRYNAFNEGRCEILRMSQVLL